MRLHTEGKFLKDETGQVKTLRGVTKTGFEDYAGGMWGGKGGWDEAKVIAELDAMKSWGCNTVRIVECVRFWKEDIDNHRRHIKDFLSLALTRGIYVIFAGYQVQDYLSGGRQDKLPYPPFQSGDWSSIIASEQEFIDWWVSVSQELKLYPNVIYELWNEACQTRADTAAEDSWHVVAQQIIDSIRVNGDENPVIIQFFYDVWYTYEGPIYSKGVEWIENHIMTGTNIIYSTHFYTSTVGSDKPYDIDTLRSRMEYLKFNWVGDTLNLPFMVGESGCSLASSFSEEEQLQELLRWKNILTVLNEWKIGFTAWWWRDSGVNRLLTYGEGWNPVPSPSLSGQILIDAIAAVTPEPPPQVYTCPICGATFSTQAELDAHMASAHPTEPQEGNMEAVFFMVILLALIWYLGGKK
jgi:hypothetical protein